MLCLATIPTIGDALEALKDLTSDVTEALKEISDLSAELASKDQIAVADIQEVGSLNPPNHPISAHILLQMITSSDVNLLENLDIAKMRSLMSRELEAKRNSAKESVTVLLSMAYFVINL